MCSQLLRSCRRSFRNEAQARRILSPTLWVPPLVCSWRDLKLTEVYLNDWFRADWRTRVCPEEKHIGATRQKLSVVACMSAGTVSSRANLLANFLKSHVMLSLAKCRCTDSAGCCNVRAYVRSVLTRTVHGFDAVEIAGFAGGATLDCSSALARSAGLWWTAYRTKPMNDLGSEFPIVPIPAGVIRVVPPRQSGAASFVFRGEVDSCGSVRAGRRTLRPRIRVRQHEKRSTTAKLYRFGYECQCTKPIC